MSKEEKRAQAQREKEVAAARKEQKEKDKAKGEEKRALKGLARVSLGMSYFYTLCIIPFAGSWDNGLSHSTLCSMGAGTIVSLALHCVQRELGQWALELELPLQNQE